MYILHTFVSTLYKNGHSGFYVVWSNEEATQDHEISLEDTLTHDNSFVIALARTSQYLNSYSRMY